MPKSKTLQRTYEVLHADRAEPTTAQLTGVKQRLVNEAEKEGFTVSGEVKVTGRTRRIGHGSKLTLSARVSEKSESGDGDDES